MDKATGFKYPSQIIVDALRLIGFTVSKVVWFVRYEGRENIPPNNSAPFLIVSNHQTYVDPVWICLPMRRRIRYMAFGPAFEWRLVGPLIAYLGAFPVSLDPKAAVKVMKEAIKSLRDGAVLTIFPEAAREFSDGQMLDFKTGAVRIALQAKVPILPVTITGGNHIWPQKQKYPHLFRRVTIKYHPIMEINEDAGIDLRQNLNRLTDRLKNVIAGKP